MKYNLIFEDTFSKCWGVSRIESDRLLAVVKTHDGKAFEIQFLETTPTLCRVILEDLEEAVNAGVFENE